MVGRPLGRWAAVSLMFAWAAGGTIALGDPGDLKARQAALVKEFDDRFESARKANAAAAKWPDRWDYAPRFLALAREKPADSAACDALCWIIEHNIDVHRRKDGVAIGLEAADLLIRHHLDDDRLGRACLQATFGASMPSPARDRLFPAVLQKTRDGENRGRGCLAMAQYLKSRADLLEQLRLPGGDELAALMEQWTSEEYLASFRHDDPRALLEESERLFRRVIAEFGSLEYIFEHRHPGRPRTLREIAEPELYEVTHLAIGRVAPEIAGEDLDGKPMKLGDYRGKVVVVSFWGAWCGACMAMVPNERDLAARLEGRPFAIVGVNSDEDRARARETKASQRMRWRSWWDGKVGGPIAGAWNVRLWPTFFIIDARGVIRAHGVLGEDMIAKTVDALLKEAEGASARAGDAWHLEFEEGRSAAKANGKDLLIDFGGSDWCLPCRWLKERVLSRPAFIERAAGTFVLVDIDLPASAPIAADRKRRYQELQERYGISSFPTVVLALPDGRPYARTTYREACKTPESYWKHLEPLHERGRRLRDGLARARHLEGRERAEAIAEGLGQVNPRFILRFYADEVAELRKVDPSDTTGYLGFLDGRRALDEFQSGWDLHKAAIDPAAVDSLIARAKLRGESLQEALVLRAAGEILAGEDRKALRSLAAAVDAQSTRTRFDRGDFVLLDAASIATVRRRLAEGEADRGDGVALGYVLHRILEFDLPNPYEWSCGEAFRPNIRVREVLGDRYGRALIRSTEKLQGEARARALAKGLDGTFFVARGSIREIILELIPGLVGKQEAKKLLPGEFYPKLIN